MNEEKRLFETRGKEVFNLLESAINYAALCHPDEFFERRDQIAQLVFARQQQPRGINTDHDDASDFSDHMALRIKEHWAKGCVDFASKKSTHESMPDSNIVISDSEKCPASGIGMDTEDEKPKKSHIIRLKLRPKPKKEEQLEEAESQVAIEGSSKNTTRSEEQKPRALAKEKDSETKRDAEVKLPVPHRVPKKSCTKSSEAGIVTGKFSDKSRMMIKEQKSMGSDYEFKLEASKRKLLKGYEKFEDAKEKKKIRMIELKDLPRGRNRLQAGEHVRSNNGRPMNGIRSGCIR